MVAINTYNFEVKFNTYWTSVASNEMINAIEKESVYYRTNGLYKNFYLSKDNEDTIVMSNGIYSKNDASEYLALEEIMDFLYDPRNHIPQEDIAVFLYYVSSSSFKQTAEHFHITYGIAYNKIKRTRKKIINILYKSKD